jgi:hypothetical protein
MHKQLTSLSTWKTRAWSAQALASHHVSDAWCCMTAMQRCADRQCYLDGGSSLSYAPFRPSTRSRV